MHVKVVIYIYLFKAGSFLLKIPQPLASRRIRQMNIAVTKLSTTKEVEKTPILLFPFLE